MKKLFLFSVLLLFSALAQGQTVRSHAAGACTSVALCPTTSITALSGDSIFIFCGTNSTATLNTPTDAGSNTYTNIAGPTTHGGTIGQLWKKDGATGFTGTAVCHTAASTGGIESRVIDIAGTTGFDTNATNHALSATASPWVSNALTTTQANDIVITCVDNDAISHGYTVPSGFIATDVDSQTACAYRTVFAIQSAATYTWTGTGAADNMLVIVASFQGSASPRRAMVQE